MSDRSARNWCRKFRDVYTDVHDKGKQEWHPIVTDELVQKADEVKHKKTLHNSELSGEFPHISRTSLFRTATRRLDYQQGVKNRMDTLASPFSDKGLQKLVPQYASI